MSMSAPVSSFGSFTTPVPHMDGREGASGLEGVIGRHESPGPSTSSDRTFPWTPGVNPPVPWQVDVDGAREEARRQVTQMLQRPEDLARLPELREAVAAKLQRLDLVMTSQLEAATDGTRVGLDGLQKARGAVLRTRDNFSQIEAPSKGEKAGGLADNHHLIRDLAVMRANISRTIRDAEAVVALPEEAARAIELLDDDEQNLFECWERLSKLAQRARPARAALDAARRRADNDATALSMTEPAAAQFAAIDDAMDRFETTLWRSVRGSLFAGRGGSAALARAMRVVEEQEALDELLVEKAEKVRERAVRKNKASDELVDSIVMVSKHYKRQVLREIREAVPERFEMTVGSLVTDPGGEEATNVPVVIENLDVLMQQLTELYDYAVPAFPTKYKTFELVVAPAWHKQICLFIDRLVEVARDLSNADIIAVLNWYQSYAAQMDALGVEVETEPSESEVAIGTPPVSVHDKNGGLQPGGKNEKGDSPSVLSIESFLSSTHGAVMTTNKIDKICSDEVEYTISDDEEGGDVLMTYPVGFFELVNIYTSRMTKTVQTWSANLRRMTTTQPLKPAEDGTLWTASDVEFFRLLNEQLEVAMSGGKILVSAAAMVISSALSGFASEQYKRLSGEGVSSTNAALASPSFSRHFRTTSNVIENAAERAVMTAAKNVDYNVLLAGVNDASRCHRLALEMESSLVDALQSSDAMKRLVKKAGDAATGKSSVVRPAIDMFLANTEHCAAAAAAAVTSDPSVISLFGQMYAVDKGGTSPWLEGEVTETLVATVLDYLGDVVQFVTRDLASMVNEAVFNRVVKHMIEACMKQLQTIRPETVGRMEDDENALRECFENFLPSNRLDLGLQRLADVRDLAAADDTESFVLAYGLVVQSMPELGIEPAERLLAAREDIPRATQREVLEECRELLSNQMAIRK